MQESINTTRILDFDIDSIVVDTASDINIGEYVNDTTVQNDTIPYTLILEDNVGSSTPEWKNSSFIRLPYDVAGYDGLVGGYFCKYDSHWYLLGGVDPLNSSIMNDDIYYIKDPHTKDSESEWIYVDSIKNKYLPAIAELWGCVSLVKDTLYINPLYYGINVLFKYSLSDIKMSYSYKPDYVDWYNAYQCVIYNGSYIFMLGGFDSSNDKEASIIVYDPSKDVFLNNTRGKYINDKVEGLGIDKAMVYQQCVYYKSYIYILGWVELNLENNTAFYSNDMYVYSFKERAWSYSYDVLKKSEITASVNLVKNKIYFVGGLSLTNLTYDVDNTQMEMCEISSNNPFNVKCQICNSKMNYPDTSRSVMGFFDDNKNKIYATGGAKYEKISKHHYQIVESKNAFEMSL